jgi:hypothetical protein
VLRVDEAPDVLRLLWRHGVSRAKLMPTFDNVTRSLLSQWKWQSRTV